MDSLLSLYSSCTLCPNMCAVDRRKEKGVCGESDKVRIAWAGLHKGEEPPIAGEKGSGMIFFTGCPLRCSYCQNYEISSSRVCENWGFEISIEEMTNIMLDLERMGAKTLNLVTATHFIPSVISSLNRAKEENLTLPVVWNSSGYETKEALLLLNPYIDIFLLDAKTIDKKVSFLFCGGEKYSAIIVDLLDFLKEMRKDTDLTKMRGTIVRHLVFPSSLNATKDFLHLFGKKYKDAFVLSLMTQFVSPFKEKSFPPLKRKEYNELIKTLEREGIDDGFIQEMGGNDSLWLPSFKSDMPFPEGFAEASKYFLSLKRKALSR